jgi:DnaJ-class molecular chaperone
MLALMDRKAWHVSLQIAAAYEVLSDPDKRAVYDQVSFSHAASFVCHPNRSHGPSEAPLLQGCTATSIATGDVDLFHQALCFSIACHCMSIDESCCAAM